MTGQGPGEAVEAAVEGCYGKRIGTLRMLGAGVSEGLVEVLKPQLGRLEAELRGWRAGERLPDGTVLDLYLDTFDPEHPDDDLRALADAAAEDERRARLLLRRELEWAMALNPTPTHRPLPHLLAGRPDRQFGPAIPARPTCAEPSGTCWSSTAAPSARR